MELSNRMKAVAELVPCGHTAADVGCDHGFVSIYLAQHGICPYIFAGDVRKGPLERAKEHIRESGLTDRIGAVLSDGLKEIPVAGAHMGGEEKHGGKALGEDKDAACAEGADGFIAAGMGGKLIVQILTDVPQKTAALTWCVLSPQSEIWLVRQKLAELGFLILRENMVLEDGKFYPMMLAVWENGTEWSGRAADVRRSNEALVKRLEESGFSKEEREKAADWLGLRLMDDRNGVLISFLEHTMATDRDLIAGMPAFSGQEDDPGQEDHPEKCADATLDTVPDAKKERIAQRRRELLAHMTLAGKVLGFLGEE